MKATEFTAETGDQIVACLQEYAKLDKHMYCAAHILFNQPRKEGWVAEGTPCARYTCGQLIKNMSAHPDIVGIPYQGVCPPEYKYVPTYNRLAYTYLKYLLNPKGPFKELLPFLYHSTTKEVFRDKGFVFKDLSKVNPGLLWTFIQGSRLFFEYPNRAEYFREIRKLTRDPVIGLLCSWSVMPADDDLKDWLPYCAAHGEPLGAKPFFGYNCRERFLKCEVLPTKHHTCQNSQMCFNPSTTYVYKSCNDLPRKPLAEWVKEYQEVKGEK